jgi:hypothetical protein
MLSSDMMVTEWREVSGCQNQRIEKWKKTHREKGQKPREERQMGRAQTCGPNTRRMNLGGAKKDGDGLIKGETGVDRKKMKRRNW